MHPSAAIFTFLLFLGGPAQEAHAGQESPSPSWIWNKPEAQENERVFFRREFQLPPDVVSATITIACDDWQRLTFNGQEIGMASPWNESRTYEVLSKLNSDGSNIINVEASNERGPAGLALHFRATLKDGKVLHLVSDSQWSCNIQAPEGWLTTPYDGSAWPRAIVVAKMGDAPWGDIMPRDQAAQSTVPAPSAIGSSLTIAPGP